MSCRQAFPKFVSPLRRWIWSNEWVARLSRMNGRRSAAQAAHAAAATRAGHLAATQTKPMRAPTLLLAQH